ncbi:MAG: TIGR00341 family protein [Prevotellaceae bacterium]|nr:TIGR00341 family protein [Candidatus Minthosoma caballi]
MKNSLTEIAVFMKRKLDYLFGLGEDAASEEDVIEGIKQGIQFRGAKLWILILAIFVASLGLNTNSAAVIIGAMLISPLMGPIIGMGLGSGIYDFELLRRSWHNYIVATLFSIVTATVYFLITPIADAQSELLARTSPTIYDVLIALCGGLAGIVALSSRSQRTGNVIPGVAIATALMPPLCTVGFGIATANWAYALGALYLFVINTIFIATATFIGAVFIMRFKKKAFIDASREKKVKFTIYAVAIITVLPAIMLTLGMVHESYFEQRVRNFIKKEMVFPSTHVLSHHTEFKTKSFNVVLIGAEVDSAQLQSVREKLPYYDLEGVQMEVLQGTANINAEEFRHMIHDSNTRLTDNEAVISQQRAHLAELEMQLQAYHDAESSAKNICSELQVLYPQVQGVSMAKGAVASADTTAAQVVAVIDISSSLSAAEISRLKEWMTRRTGVEGLRIVLNKENKE